MADTIDMARVRAHIHAGRKIRLDYRDEAGRYDGIASIESSFALSKVKYSIALPV